MAAEWADGFHISRTDNSNTWVGWGGWADLAVSGTGNEDPISLTGPASNLKVRPTSMMYQYSLLRKVCVVFWGDWVIAIAIGVIG